MIIALLVIIWNPAAPIETEHEATNTVLVFFDSSQSMSVTDSRQQSQLDRAVELFDRYFRHGHEPLPNFRLYGFDSTCYSCRDTTGLHRWGIQSDMQRTLATLRQYDRPTETSDRFGGSSAVAGAVIFTDGQADQKNHKLYFPLQQDDTPILLVGTGLDKPVFDVAVAAIRTPATTAVNTMYSLDAVVTAEGLDRDEPVTIELLRDDHVMDRIRRTTAELKQNGQVRFTVNADTLGWQRVGVRASIDRPECNPANNIRQTMVRVAQNDDIKVLLYCQAINFDIGKIRSALERDRKVQLDIGLDAVIAPAVSKAYKNMAGHVALPTDMAGFNPYDVVILGPMDFDAMPEEQIDALYRFVTDRGGGLIVLPGKMPAHELGRVKNRKIRALLPVDFTGAVAQDQRSAAVTWTLEGRNSGVLSSPDIEQDDLELLVPYKDLWKKPAATIIMTTEHDNPVLCTQHVGRGRVAVLNAAAMFRWYRQNEDGGLLQMFLSGLTSYVGRTTRLEAGVELFVQRDITEQTRVNFDAYAYDENFSPIPEATVLLEFDGKVLCMDPVEDGHYAAQVDHVTDEAIVARAEAQKQGIFLGERTCAVTLPMPRGEMDQTVLDDVFLKNLAHQIGAQYLPAEAVDEQTVKQFRPTRPVVNISTLQSVWPRWSILLGLCGALTLIWFIRRMRGLV